MNIGNLLGARIFNRDENDNLNVFKVVSFVNENEVRIKNIESNEKKRIKITDITEGDEYSVLNPDGYIIFSIVDIGANKKDIIVSMHRLSDIKGNDEKPYCVARQAVVNIYNEVVKKYENNTHVGMCMSINTIPEGVNYDMMCACESVELSTCISYYLDDKLEEILECITNKNMGKYNRVLEDLFMDNYNKLSAMEKSEYILKMNNYHGYCRDLKTFITYHEFMYDVRYGFGVASLNTYCYFKEEARVPEAKVVEEIEKVYGFKILNPYMIKYSKDINLSEIKRKYLLCIDLFEDVYVVLYDSVDDVKEEMRDNETMSVYDRMAYLNKLQ